MNLDIKFRNQFQETGYFLRQRNQCLSGGFNNGKTYVMYPEHVVLMVRIFSTGSCTVTKSPRIGGWHVQRC